MSRYPSKTLKLEIKERDLGLCRYCGTIPLVAHYDHVIPYAIGGPTSLSNMVYSCSDCNWEKGEQTWRPIPIGQNYANREIQIIGSNEPVEKIVWAKHEVGRGKDPALIKHRPWHFTEKNIYHKRGKVQGVPNPDKKKNPVTKKGGKKCVFCGCLGSNGKTVTGLNYHYDCLPIKA